jgi:hypothetical protein
MRNKHSNRSRLLGEIVGGQVDGDGAALRKVTLHREGERCDRRRVFQRNAIAIRHHHTDVMHLAPQYGETGRTLAYKLSRRLDLQTCAAGGNLTPSCELAFGKRDSVRPASRQSTT